MPRALRLGRRRGGRLDQERHPAARGGGSLDRRGARGLDPARAAEAPPVPGVLGATEPAAPLGRVVAGRRSLGVERERGVTGRRLAAAERVTGRSLAAAERVAGRSLAAAERVAGRSLAAAERVAGRSLAAAERVAGRSLAAAERVAGRSLAAAERVAWRCRARRGLGHRRLAAARLARGHRGKCLVDDLAARRRDDGRRGPAPRRGADRQHRQHTRPGQRRERETEEQHGAAAVGRHRGTRVLRGRGFVQRRRRLLSERAAGRAERQRRDRRENRHPWWHRETDPNRASQPRRGLTEELR